MKITQKFLRNELAALKEKYELAKNQVAITYGAMQTIEQMLHFAKKKNGSVEVPEEMEKVELEEGTPDATGPQDDEDGLSNPGHQPELGV